MSFITTKIFIVEDSGVVALDLKMSLLGMGYEVLGIASSGEEAVEKIFKAKPNLVLMDIKLKGDLDGIQTAALIRKQLDIPVIYLTAYSDSETLERAKLTDPSGYIIKPFEERDLKTIIEIALYKYKQARKLRESEKWLSTTLQSIGDGVITTDEAGKVTFLNPIAQQLTGWKPEEAYKRPFAEIYKIINEVTGETLKDPVQRVFEEEKIVDLVNQSLLVNRNGEQIPIDNIASPIKNASGKIIGVVFIFRDITQRRKAERCLEQSEERYRAVVEQTVESIYLTDWKTKKVVEANGTFADLLGYTTEEIVNMPVYQIIDHRADNINERLAQLHIDKKPVIGERRYRRKDGNLVELQVSASLIKYGDREVICTVARDISAKKQAEAALRRSEARFRILANAIPDLMLRINVDGTILDSKPALDLNSPLCSDNILGKNFYHLFPDKYEDDFRVLVDKALQVLKVQILEYQEIIAENTYEREARVNSIAPDEVLVIVRDITARKKMEKQLKYLSLHDALTGIYNRTYFEEEIRRLESMRQMEIGIIICDLDGLKLINDTMGHDRGDALLIAVAQILKDQVRPMDFAARIGGDEFAILIRENNLKTVERICTRLREQVKLYNISHPEFPINLSFGFAVNNSSLMSIRSVFKEADDNMYREKLCRSKSARSTIVQAMMKVLEMKDFITEGHANRLRDLIVKLAHELNLSEPTVNNLGLFAQFHDIGKVGTPDRVLFKPGVLTQEEKVEIQRHAEIGHRIAKSIPELEPIADWILKHHEWWNGCGYPLGLTGEDIPLESRILAIADAYDAMISDRPYRHGLSHEAAIVEIKKCAGKQFDPNLVSKFVAILGKNRLHQLNNQA